jgi:hypothetical protein
MERETADAPVSDSRGLRRRSIVVDPTLLPTEPQVKPEFERPAFARTREIRTLRSPTVADKPQDWRLIAVNRNTDQLFGFAFQ